MEYFTGKKLQTIAKEAAELEDLYKTGNIRNSKPKRILTVVDFGDYGIESVSIDPSPYQPAILGIGAMALKPFRESGDIIYKECVSFILTVNGQFFDKFESARFLNKFCKYFENVNLLLTF